ncbi:MAG: hypothetical protein ACJ788_00070 [Ktedonobacteraceae bacterium]
MAVPLNTNRDDAAILNANSGGLDNDDGEDPTGGQAKSPRMFRPKAPRKVPKRQVVKTDKEPVARVRLTRGASNVQP